MNQHKHAEMIKAKADNMDLEVLKKGLNKTKWVGGCAHELFYLDADYFLCLPQHKEACLHWLNGGEVEECINTKWSDVDSSTLIDWEGMSDPFMREESNFRIKPPTEKRWVIWDKRLKSVAAIEPVEPKQRNKDYYQKYQIIEIEVEV